MKVSIQVSFYPLRENNYRNIISGFIKDIKKYKNINLESSNMATIIYGDIDKIFKILTNLSKKYLEKYDGIIDFKLSNSCIK